jgi:ABC-type transport system involved in cytochrome c biogenesis ATPase subunit
LWILDEPFNGLDQMGTEHLYQTMLNHLQNKGFLILTSHLHQNFQHVIANDPALREKIITL